MIAYATHEFTLARREADGRTTREHLQFVAKKSPKAREQLKAPPFPVEYEAVWRAFLEMDRWRGAGGFGMSPLTMQDLEAWERRTGVTLSLHEADVVKRLDIARLNVDAPAKPVPGKP